MALSKQLTPHIRPSVLIVFTLTLAGIAILAAPKLLNNQKNQPQQLVTKVSPAPPSPTVCLFPLTPTNLDAPTGWKTYIDLDKKYIFSMPQNWEVKMQGVSFKKDSCAYSYEGNVIASFQENNQSYTPTLAIGLGGHDVPESDRIVTRQVQLSDDTYNATLIYSDQKEQPYEVDINATNVKTFSQHPEKAPSIRITNPPKNIDYYLNIFAKILSTFKYIY